MDSWHSLTLFVSSENVLSSKKRLDQILDGTSLILHGNELDRVFHCLIDELPIKAALQGDFVQAIANEN
ncbi:MAG: hypothetical protein KIT34_01830 [Cyanobacteria bacterium TGS_CYA1]|nr:hypothetical protein [Cyanobacteria bacterium TGS_CYA1]